MAKLDADDLLSPDKIAKQIKAAQENPSPGTLFSSEWGYSAYRTDRAEFQRDKAMYKLERVLRGNLAVNNSLSRASRRTIEYKQTD